MTQAEVAHALGVSIGTYQKIENNPGETRWKHAERIAEILGVPVGSLFFRPDSSSTVVGEEASDDREARA
jgi:DNA-binding XRE family transcriptional regulator